MSLELSTPLPIMKIRGAKANISFLQGFPQGDAKIQFLSDDGAIIGGVDFSAFSANTWEAAQKLMESIEDDFILYSRENYRPWGKQTARREEDILQEEPEDFIDPEEGGEGAPAETWR